MAARVLAALVLITAGSLLAVPIAILLGAVTLLLEVVHAAWARNGLSGVRYRRHLGARARRVRRRAAPLRRGLEPPPPAARLAPGGR